MTGRPRIRVSIDRLCVPPGTSGPALARAIEAELRRQLTGTQTAAATEVPKLAVPAGAAPARTAASAIAGTVKGKTGGGQ